MEWRIIKMGTEMFDTLHAYGLGIVVAYATNEPVILQDEGVCYRLTSPCISVPQASIDLLDDVFRLPEPAEVRHLAQALAKTSHLTIPLAVANLDGLLAALFTNPYVVRSCSLSALLHKQRFDPAIIERGIASIHDIIARWKTRMAQEAGVTSLWLDELLKDYDALCPCQPLPVAMNGEKSITVAMTLDPSLGYASRQPHSDGRVAKKVNMTLRGTRFAALLAYIGAMRFLRAQQVAGNLIAYSVPVASTLILHTESVRPLLWSCENESEEALVLQWLDLATNESQIEGQWKGLSYQVLQVQAKQAISRSRGALDLTWLNPLNHQLLRYWKWLLRTPQRERPYEPHHLIVALVTSQRYEWEAHLFDVAQAELARRPRQDQNGHVDWLRLYSIHEIQEVSAAMESSVPTPLSTILARKEGTMHFGHALRQLKECASAIVREILEDLESVRTRDQLMDVLTHLLQTCEVMDAKSPFLIIPSDQDLKLLLEDEERYGAHTIAGLLRLLSTLRYTPRNEEADQEGYTHIRPEASDPDTLDTSTSSE